MISPAVDRQNVASKGASTQSAPGNADRQTSIDQCAAVFRREESRSAALASALRASGIDATPVASADALRVLVEARRVKLLILDNQMGGFFTGMEVVQKLRTGLNWLPAIVLDEDKQRLVSEAKTLGGVGLLETTVSDEEIVKAAHRLLSRQAREQDVIPFQAQAIVDRVGELPVLSQLTCKLLQYQEMETNKVPIDELCQAISLDAKATAVVLKAANASSNGISREVATVQDAVRVLGVRPTIGTVLNAAVTAGMGGLAKNLPTELQSWHARRGMVIASTASMVAKELEDRSEETAFLLGILQDVGMLALMCTYPKEYRAALKRWRTVGHIKLAAAEQTEIGCTHGEISAAIMKRWDMPTSLLLPVLHHLGSASDADRLGLDMGVHRALSVAEALADLIDAPHAVRRHALNNLLVSYGPEKTAACQHSLKSAAVKASQAFQMLTVPVPGATQLETLLRTALSNENPSNN
ncbi:MAG TPA: HDOD domain-containing protein [Planctomycetaceae bacterium]|jgi:HD-like signal output (HDOD) protein|nr:HDOD domain-containing protein [Planctomycetaceae bacterium]